MKELIAKAKAVIEELEQKWTEMEEVRTAKVEILTPNEETHVEQTSDDGNPKQEG